MKRIITVMLAALLLISFFASCSDGGAPFVYIYCGNSSADGPEQYLYKSAVEMPGYLADIDYPEDRVVLKTYDKGVHNELYWRVVFPDFLKYMFKD